NLSPEEDSAYMLGDSIWNRVVDTRQRSDWDLLLGRASEAAVEPVEVAMMGCEASILGLSDSDIHSADPKPIALFERRQHALESIRGEQPASKQSLCPTQHVFGR